MTASSLRAAAFGESERGASSTSSVLTRLPSNEVRLVVGGYTNVKWEEPRARTAASAATGSHSSSWARAQPPGALDRQGNALGAPTAACAATGAHSLSWARAKPPGATGVKKNAPRTSDARARPAPPGTASLQDNPLGSPATASAATGASARGKLPGPSCSVAATAAIESHTGDAALRAPPTTGAAAQRAPHFKAGRGKLLPDIAGPASPRPRAQPLSGRLMGAPNPASAKVASSAVKALNELTTGDAAQSAPPIDASPDKAALDPSIASVGFAGVKDSPARPFPEPIAPAAPAAPAAPEKKTGAKVPPGVSPSAPSATAGAITSLGEVGMTLEPPAYPVPLAARQAPRNLPSDPACMNDKP